VVAAISAVGIDEGAVRSGMDRYEELTCEGEKPRTTLVVLRSEVPLASDEAGWAEWSDASSEVKDLLSAVDVVIWGVGAAACLGSGVFLGRGAR